MNDMLREAMNETALENILVKDAMTPHVIAVNEGDSFLQAMILFEEEQISGAPVKNQDGQYVGILSKTDFAKEKVRSLIVSGRQNEKNYAISSIMNPNKPLTILHTATLKEAAKLMTDNHYHRLFVVNNRNHIIGVISSLDIVMSFVR